MADRDLPRLDLKERLTKPKTAEEKAKEFRSGAVESPMFDPMDFIVPMAGGAIRKAVTKMGTDAASEAAVRAASRGAAAKELMKDAEEASARKLQIAANKKAYLQAGDDWVEEQAIGRLGRLPEIKNKITMLEMDIAKAHKDPSVHAADIKDMYKQLSYLKEDLGNVTKSNQKIGLNTTAMGRDTKDLKDIVSKEAQGSFPSSSESWREEVPFERTMPLQQDLSKKAIEDKWKSREVGKASIAIPALTNKEKDK